MIVYQAYPYGRAGKSKSPVCYYNTQEIFYMKNSARIFPNLAVKKAGKLPELRATKSESTYQSIF